MGKTKIFGCAERTSREDAENRIQFHVRDEPAQTSIIGEGAETWSIGIWYVQQHPVTVMASNDPERAKRVQKIE